MVSTARLAHSRPDPIESYLTVDQAVDLLGMTGATVRNWVRDGTLTRYERKHDTRDQMILVVDPRELAAIPRRMRSRIVVDDPDEITARAFEIFDQGGTMRDAVVKLRKKAETVEELRQQWESLGGAELVLTPAAKRELERFVGPFTGIADLVEILKGKLGVAIEAEVPDDATDAQIEGAINAVLDREDARAKAAS